MLIQKYQKWKKYIWKLIFKAWKPFEWFWILQILSSFHISTSKLSPREHRNNCRLVYVLSLTIWNNFFYILMFLHIVELISKKLLLVYIFKQEFINRYSFIFNWAKNRKLWKKVLWNILDVRAQLLNLKIEKKDLLDSNQSDIRQKHSRQAWQEHMSPLDIARFFFFLYWFNRN